MITVLFSPFGTEERPPGGNGGLCDRSQLPCDTSIPRNRQALVLNTRMRLGQLACVSAGLTEHASEAHKLFKAVDSSESGDIDFEEFLDVLNPSSSISADMFSEENLAQFISPQQVRRRLSSA